MCQNERRNFLTATSQFQKIFRRIKILKIKLYIGPYKIRNSFYQKCLIAVFNRIKKKPEGLPSLCLKGDYQCKTHLDQDVLNLA